MIGIYKITNTLTNKIYIGQSIDIEKRWEAHKLTINNSNIEAYERELYKDMRIFGLNNFSFEIIEECSFEELNEKEKYWIQYFNSYEEGYNNTRGGSGTLKYDYDKVKELWQQGLTTKEISMQMNINYAQTNIILGILGISNKEKYNRNSSSNDSHSRYSKKVYQKDLLTHAIINVFESVSEAAQFLGIERSTFREALQKHNNNYRGFYWEIDNSSIKEKRNFSAKKVIKLDPITKESIEQFDSVSAAARAMNVAGATIISRACKQQTLSCGFYWKYL